MRSEEVDYLIIGGGFYGCCLGLFLRSISDRLVIVEADSRIMQRASRINQARVHSGFHYPRSVLTAVKSRSLHRRFATDFADAVKSDFRMLYAIARHHSKVPASRFFRMFHDMGAPIGIADPKQQSLFNFAMVEAVFDCREFAFDYSVLGDMLMSRLDLLNAAPRLGTEVQNVEEKDDCVVVTLESGHEIRSRFVFNVTYGHINHVLRMAALPEAKLKFELAEIVLVTPPDELQGLAITMMDGPFFSIMPYPAEDLYSLTHVRYTPHLSWLDSDVKTPPYEIASRYVGSSHARQMVQDGKRFVPCLDKVKFEKSLFEIKAVLEKNEQDDGRPILFQRRPEGSRVISILGGKIDNIYDLFDLVRTIEPEFSAADERHLSGRVAAPSA